MNNPIEYVLGAVCVVLAVLLGLQTIRLSEAKKEKAEIAADFSDAMKESAEKAAEESEAYRAKEQALRASVATAQQEYNQKKAQDEAVFSTLRHDLDGLRNQINDYAAGGSAATNPPTADSERAATLGVLLAEALQSDAECARSAEDHANGIRSLLAAWPSEVSKNE